MKGWKCFRLLLSVSERCGQMRDMGQGLEPGLVSQDHWNPQAPFRKETCQAWQHGPRQGHPQTKTTVPEKESLPPADPMQPNTQTRGFSVSRPLLERCFLLPFSKSGPRGHGTWHCPPSEPWDPRPMPRTRVSLQTTSLCPFSKNSASKMNLLLLIHANT